MENFEKLEAYFNNELNDSEKSDFLREIESNTELKSEYNFQNEVINGIKEARKAELKAMLDNVTIISVSTVSTGLMKILAVGTATLIVGTAIWYYYNTTTPLEIDNENTLIEIAPLTENDSLIKNETEELKKENDSITITEESGKTNTTKIVNNDNPTIITPVLPSSADEIISQSLPEENLEIPNDISKANINLASKVDIEIKLKKKYSFHYQYSQGKLILYGNFEEDLFEILELNKENEVEIYLYYKSNYYYIEDKSDSIIPLKSVKSERLKLKLEGLR